MYFIYFLLELWLLFVFFLPVEYIVIVIITVAVLALVFSLETATERIRAKLGAVSLLYLHGAWSAEFWLYITGAPVDVARWRSIFIWWSSCAKLSLLAKGFRF